MKTITNSATNSTKIGKYTVEQVNAKYLELMPLITKTATIAFGKCSPPIREEAVQSTETWAFVMLRQLAVSGRLDEAKATPLAWYGIKRHREGRLVGTRSSTTDVLSARCQYLGRAKLVTESVGGGFIDAFVSESEIVDARHSVDRTVQFRLDFFEGWLR